MNSIIGLSVVFIVFMFLFSIQLLVRAKQPLKKTLLGMLAGICTLVAVNISGMFTGVTLTVSLLSVAVAAVAGIPGVTTMLVLNMIL